MLTIQTPAKINLTLEVLGKRQDDFHEIRSVMQTIGLYDTLNLEKARKTTVTSSYPGFRGEASLISRAVEKVQKRTRCKNKVSIYVEKQIPLLSGLGGDSSDAAAVIKGLNQLWELNLTKEDMNEIATELGSDVPFFLNGGTALAEGHGEKIQQLPRLPRKWVVLVLPKVPAEPGKTAQMYASLKPAHCSDGQATRRLVEALITGLPVRQTMFINSFEHVAFHPDSVLSVFKSHLLKLGAPHVHLCGSGPSMFVLYDEKDRAEDLAVKCQNQGSKSAGSKYFMKNLRIWGKPPFSAVVLHGGPGAAGAVAPVAEELSTGIGVLEPLQTRDSINGQVEELKEIVITAAQVPAVIVGHSWGAYLGFIFASRYPEPVKKLILIASPPFEQIYAESIGPERLNRLSEEERLEALALIDEVNEPGKRNSAAPMARLAELFEHVDEYDPLPGEKRQ